MIPSPYPSPEPPPGVHAGIDIYGGVSSRPGLRRFTDQLWAGNQLFTPSVGYLRWDNGQKTSARIALGIGQSTTGRDPLFKQPVELWVRQQERSGALTTGRFFATFGQNEWQFESRDGVQWESGAVTLAIQNNKDTQRANGYLRAQHTLSKTDQVGLSLAAGRGFSYSSGFDQGIGVDATLVRGPWQLRSELDRFSDSQRARFEFAFSSLTYQRLPAGIEPFVRYYQWHDASRAQALGSYHTLIGGLTAPIGPGLSLEAASAKDGSRQNTWVQLQFTWER